MLPSCETNANALTGGGQKARVGLARAVYHALMERKLMQARAQARSGGMETKPAPYEDEEVMVCCDDPFSALDPNVANAIWEQVIQDLLNGFTRVVCLNSNLGLASKADRLVVLEDGKITAQGSPNEILTNPEFAWLFDARDAESNHEEEPAIQEDLAIVDASLKAVQVEEDDKPADAEDKSSRSSSGSQDTRSGEISAGPSSDKLASVTPSGPTSTVGTVEPQQIPSTSIPDKTAVAPPSGKLYKIEERAKGTVSMRTYWDWLKSGAFWDSPRVSLIILVSMYLITQGVKVFADLWLGLWSRSAQFSNKGLGLGIYFGAVVGMVTFALLRAWVFTNIAARASVRLHQDLITNVLRAPVNLFFDVTPVGRILNRLSSDMDHMDTKLPEVALQLLHASAMILGAIIMAAIASPYILPILVPLVFVFSQLAKRLSRCQRELKRFDGLTRSPLFSHFGETLSGLTTIRSFRVADEFREENAKLLDTNTRFFFLFWMTARWLALRVDLLAVICQFSICSLALGTKSSSQNTAIVGLAVTYSLMLTTTVQACTRYVIETENSMIACERILDLIHNVPQERQDGDDTFTITKGEVEFQNVCARYRPLLDLCIRNVSFKVQAGQKVGLCGRSGSGKSTLGNLLFGMIQVESGKLLFDGKDSKDISLHCLRSQMSVIPYVFADNFRLDMLRLTRP